MLRGRLWTAVTPTPPPPSALSHWPIKKVQMTYSDTRNDYYRIEKAAEAIMTSQMLFKHSNTHIHLYLVVAQHFKQLLVALLRDEDTLSRGDTATAGQTVIQCDLCFLQLLLPTILQTQGKLKVNGSSILQFE